MFAHGLGERGDLPLEIWMFAAGLAAALAISVFALGRFWKRPLLANNSGGVALVSYRKVAAIHWPIKVLGFGLYALCIYAGFYGEDVPGLNVLPVTFYVTAWVGAQLFGGLLGDTWRLVNPIYSLAQLAELPKRVLGLFRTVKTPPTQLASLLSLSVAWSFVFDEVLRSQGTGSLAVRLVFWLPTAAFALATPWCLFADNNSEDLLIAQKEGLPGARWLRSQFDDIPDIGQWPAVAGLTLFLFYELSHPEGVQPSTLALVISVHALTTIFLGLFWGAEWVRENEPFTVFFAKVAQMAPLYFHDGQLRARWPLTGLSEMKFRTGTTALLLTAIGGTSFDGFSESELGRNVFGDSREWDLALAEIFGLAVSIGFVALLYWAGIFWTSASTGQDFKKTWRDFAPSLVPIAFGYAIAHYFRLFADEIQSFYFRLSRPLGDEWSLADPFDQGINIFDWFDQGWTFLDSEGGFVNPVSVTIVAWIQVSAMLLGHVGAVVVSHDKALELAADPEATHTTERNVFESQLGMAAVMIAYSTLGLGLLLTA